MRGLSQPSVRTRRRSPGQPLTLVQLIRDHTYGQVRHAQNLHLIPEIESVFVGPGAARAQLPESRFVAADLPRRPTSRTPREALRIAKQLRRVRPYAIHSHSIATLPVALLLARFLRTPLAHSPHALPLSGVTGSPVEVNGAQTLLRFARALGTSFIAVSGGEGAALHELLGRDAPVRLIHNPLPPRYSGPWPQTRGGQTLLSLSPFFPQKAPFLMIDAFALVLEQEPDARLLWAGDGPLLDDCRAYAQRRGAGQATEFLGVVADPLPLLHDATVLISTSRYEALPYAILEAMAAGAAVVASDIPAHRELDPQRKALLLAEAEPQPLAAAALSLLASPARRAAQSDSARALVDREYNFAPFCDAMTAEYRRVCRLPATRAL